MYSRLQKKRKPQMRRLPADLIVENLGRGLVHSFPHLCMQLLLLLELAFPSSFCGRRRHWKQPAELPARTARRLFSAFARRVWVLDEPSCFFVDSDATFHAARTLKPPRRSLLLCGRQQSLCNRCSTEFATRKGLSPFFFYFTKFVVFIVPRQLLKPKLLTREGKQQGKMQKLQWPKIANHLRLRHQLVNKIRHLQVLELQVKWKWAIDG